MLAAAPASASAGLLAHHLGDQCFDVVGPGKVVVMSPVIGNHEISRPKRKCDRDTAELLTDAGVHSTVDSSLREKIQKAFFDPSDGARRLDQLGARIRG